jgi:hypothetical protein
MNDEVTRLRRLRRKALNGRALASYLSSGKRGGLHERAALVNWRIARIATGRLRSHPYRNYQKDPGFLERGAGLVNAYIMATLAKMRRSGMRILLDEISAVSREMDDTRALTWSAELSDALGRAQKSMRALLDEVRAQVPVNSGEPPQVRGEPRPSLSAYPYLAL